MNTLLRALTTFSTAVMLLGLTPRTATGALRAGLTRIDVTPETGVTLGGYASRTNLSRGVHDPLSARAVAFEREGKRLLLVSVDNLGFYNGTAEPLRQAILDACKLQASELFLCAIHTHSAPTLTLSAARAHLNNVAYTRALQGKLVELSRRALEQVKPVEMAVGSGASAVGVNRRETVRDNAGNVKIALGRNPGGPVDPEVQVLKLTHAGRPELAGVLFAYATHSTSLGPGNLLISGDVHGLAEQFLEQHLGPDIITPAFAGASGDIDPWYRVLPGFNTSNGWMPEPVLLGTLLGTEVGHVLRNLKPGPGGPIRTAIQSIELPGKARGEASGPGAGRPTPLAVTVACVGDVAFVGLGGEVFNELGRAIKTASPFAYTFIITHCNGTSGYVPTRSSYAQGGYEVQSSAFAPEAGEKLVAEATRMLRALRSAQE